MYDQQKLPIWHTFVLIRYCDVATILRGCCSSSLIVICWGWLLIHGTHCILHSACRVVFSSNLTLVRNYTTKTTATATSGVAVRWPRPCESKIRQTQGIDKMRFILNPHILSASSSSVVGVVGWRAGTDGARWTFMCVFLVAQYLPRGKTVGKMGQTDS